MTVTQFMRLKPKYKLRLLLVCVLALLLFLGVLWGISAGFSAIRRQIATKKLQDVTTVNVLQKETMNKILAAVKQDDSARILVIDSEAVLSDKGEVLRLEMNLLNLVSDNAADYWQLTVTEKKALLRQTSSENKNGGSLAMRKVTFKDYYPALSRINTMQLMQYLEQNFPVGVGGRYTFTDDFDNNLEPQFAPYLAGGMPGVWVSKIGAVSEFVETYVPVSRCAPMRVTIEATDPKKSKPNKPVLLPDADATIVLLESGPYTG